ncbi:glutamate racemase, partial [bacterium]|nr:glutamate racemase [bacterium]
CTHYPLLSATIQKSIDRIMGAPVSLIDSGVETAKIAKKILADKQLLSAKTRRAQHKFYVTDMPKNFMKVGERFLGSKMEDIETVNVEILGF